MSPERKIKLIHPLTPTREEIERFNQAGINWEKSFSYDLDHFMGISYKPFQDLISMGPSVTQLVLNKMQQKGPKGILWHFIMPYITGENIRVGEYLYKKGIAYSQFEGERRAWLNWGKENGYKINKSVD